MRIAQVAPLFESVPPHGYGGIERVVSYLTEEQVALGHEVTLYATRDSVTSARLRPQSTRALRMDEERADPLAEHLCMLDQVLREASDFDVIHFHNHYLHLPFASRLEPPGVTTLHDRLDGVGSRRIFRTFRTHPFVSISDAQRRPMPWLNWKRTIHHGLPPDLLPFVGSPQEYLAFMGRMSPEKGVDRAIEIATRVGLPLRIAAKVDARDRPYFEGVVRPLLDHPLIEFVGEIGGDDKAEFIGNAAALLFPIDWPEPFGLVMIEAMACGTPVVAFEYGSVAEVMQEGETGYVVRSVEEAVDVVRDIGAISRHRCREIFDERFTTRRMTEDYLTVYRSLTENPDDRRTYYSGLERARRSPRSSPIRPTR